MASGNTTAIDGVVDPVAIQQFTQLQTAGKTLREELVALLETAIKLNATLGGSTPASFAKNLAASTDATNKIIANNNKQIENEQAKAAKQEQILNKYLIMLSKQEQARQQAEIKQAQRDAKEIAAAEAKQAKLDAISERKANAQFAPGQTPYNPVTEDTGNVRYEPIITGNENMAISATKSAEAIAAENLALMEQKEVMDSLSTSYRANIELLLTLQVERAENAAAIKALTVEDAASGERMVFLTAEQLRLKTAIQQTNLTLSQQTKQMLAEDTSGAQMQARLDELRVAYSNLSKAMQDDIAVGGVWLAEIERLDIAIKAQRDSMGDTTKHVGDYERAQLKATDATALAERVSSKLVTQMIRMAAQFLLITVAFGAISWLYDWIKNLDYFTGRLDQATQNLKALNEVQKTAASDAGQIIGKYQILTDTIKDLTISYEDRLKAAIELKKLFPEELEHSTAQAIANGEEADTLDRLKDSVVALAKARAAAKEIEKQEGEIIALQMQQDKVNAAKASQIERERKKAELENKTFGANANSSTPGKTVGQQTEAILNEQIRQSKNQADRANADIQAQIKIKEQTVKYLEQYGGLQKEAETLDDKKAPKTPKPKDYGNTDLLEANRIDIEDAKKRNKAIYLDDNYSHEARLVALDQYLKKSKELLDNSAKIVNADNNMRHQQRLNALKKLKNEELDIENERISETERLNKEEVEKRKKALEAIITADKEHQQDQVEQLNQGATIATQVLQNRRDKAINDKNIALAKDKISEKEYNRDILAINDQYNIDRINQELTVQRTILAIQEGTRDVELAQAKGKGASPEELAKITSDTNKGIAGTNNKIGSLTNDLGNAVAKQGEDNVKGDKQSAAEKRKDLQESLGYAVDVTKEIQDLLDKGYEAQIAHLNKIGEKIQENAEIEKASIDRSLDTQSNKARREEILTAETASKQKNIQEQISREKHKQAVADKAAAIAEIILNTAIAVSKAPAQLGPLLGAFAIPAVIALGALQLAKVVATPIPQFAKGTPIGGHRGGYAVVGEVGPELVTEPGKPAYYSPGIATMMNLPRGTVVEPYKMLPETPKWSSTRSDNAGVIDGLNRVERAVSGQKRGNTRLSGWVESQRQADAWNNYTSNRFK